MAKTRGRFSIDQKTLWCRIDNIMSYETSSHGFRLGLSIFPSLISDGKGLALVWKVEVGWFFLILLKGKFGHFPVGILLQRWFFSGIVAKWKNALPVSVSLDTKSCHSSQIRQWYPKFCDYLSRCNRCTDCWASAKLGRTDIICK